jgi:hypothetical protein
MNKSKKNNRYRGGNGDNSNGIMSFFSNAWNATKKNSQGLIDSLTGNNNTNTTTNTSTYSSNSNSNSGSSAYGNPRTNYNTNPISSSTSVSNRYSVGGRKLKRKYKRLSKRSGLRNTALVAKTTYWINGGKTKKRRRRYKK